MMLSVLVLSFLATGNQVSAFHPRVSPLLAPKDVVESSTTSDEKDNPSKDGHDFIPKMKMNQASPPYSLLNASRSTNQSDADPGTARNLYQDSPRPEYVYQGEQQDDYMDDLEGEGGFYEQFTEDDFREPLPPSISPTDKDVDQLQAQALHARSRAVSAERELGSATRLRAIENTLSKADEAAEEAFQAAKKLGLLRSDNIDIAKQQIIFDITLSATSQARIAAAGVRLRAAEMIAELCIPERRAKEALLERMPSMNLTEASRYLYRMKEAAKQLNEQLVKFHHYEDALVTRNGMLVTSWLNGGSIHAQTSQEVQYVRLWSETGAEAIAREKLILDTITDMARRAGAKLLEAAVTALDLSEKLSEAVKAATARARDEAKARRNKQAALLAQELSTRAAAARRIRLEAEAREQAVKMIDKLQELDNRAAPWWSYMLMGAGATAGAIPSGAVILAIISKLATGAGTTASLSAGVSTVLGVANMPDDVASNTIETTLGEVEARLIGMEEPAVASAAETGSQIAETTAGMLPGLVKQLPIVSKAIVEAVGEAALLRRAGPSSEVDAATLLSKDEGLRVMVIEAVADAIEDAVRAARSDMLGPDWEN
ncbi:hypothetical protein GQ602_003629 [Ophiocordyceps camponoti-floridani]|uniref:Uncharacterized protein n=1 Tax=Ophiocordyceps camponoti-floridani TaxID=2030778 RepID=A0A8H4VEG7_9HYPO|nr:hypothetical protein GQ602_003629 [Ophiocordyceps camponoti-floridani]